MNQSDLLWYIIFGFLVNALCIYMIIESATNTKTKVRQQRAIIDLLEKLCEKQGVTKEELDVIRRARKLK